MTSRESIGSRRQVAANAARLDGVYARRSPVEAACCDSCGIFFSDGDQGKAWEKTSITGTLWTWSKEW